ncbi:unnamed protein product, partial [Ceratitis capitata]
EGLWRSTDLQQESIEISRERTQTTLPVTKKQLLKSVASRDYSKLILHHRDIEKIAGYRWKSASNLKDKEIIMT